MRRNRHAPMLPLLLAVVVIATTACGGVADDAGARAEEPRATEVELTAPDVPPLHPSVDDYPEAWVTVRGPSDGPVVLPVKVADTDERRRHGLMEVPELPAGTGMLFTFDEDRRGGFWMKDTLVPLDIAFVDGAGAVVAILSMEPCEDDPCPAYEPEVSYRTALEVPQGWFDEVGIEVGHGLHHTEPVAP